MEAEPGSAGGGAGGSAWHCRPCNSSVALAEAGHHFVDEVTKGGRVVSREPSPIRVTIWGAPTGYCRIGDVERSQSSKSDGDQAAIAGDHHLGRGGRNWRCRRNSRGRAAERSQSVGRRAARAAIADGIAALDVAICTMRAFSSRAASDCRSGVDDASTAQTTQPGRMELSA